MYTEDYSPLEYEVSEDKGRSFFRGVFKTLLGTRLHMHKAPALTVRVWANLDMHIHYSRGCST
jgi:hypothetical protein